MKLWLLFFACIVGAAIINMIPLPNYTGFIALGLGTIPVAIMVWRNDYRVFGPLMLFYTCLALSNDFTRELLK